MEHLCFWFAGFVTALAGGPLLIGIINKVKAFFAGRKGPSLFQHYYDIVKLLKKHSVYSSTTTWIFRAAPVVTLASTVAALTLLPFSGIHSPLGFTGDMILFLYLGGLGRLFTVLGAMDTGSSFEGMGSARECLFAILTEGVILAVFGGLILLTRSFSLGGMLNAMTFRFWSVEGTALLLILVAFFIVILMESCRVPMDDPETHLELTMIHEAMILDNSGPDLGLIHYTASLKLWSFLLFEGMLLLPELPGGALGAYIGETLFVLLGAAAVGVIESVTARYRFLKIPQILAGTFCVALLAVVLMILFQKGAF